jgi:peptidoglycan/LPS O-acetylase OafA/YrhL
VTFRESNPDWLGRSIYGLPLSQFDAFAAGAAISLWPVQNLLRWFAVSLILTGIAGAAVIAHQHLAYHAAIKWSLGYAMYLLQDGGFVWGYSLLNVSAALGIASAIKHAPPVLQNSALVRVGVISYGVYVYHVPLLYALHQLDLPRNALLIVYPLALYSIAELSFRYLESPFLRLKGYFSIKPTSPATSGGCRSTPGPDPA